MYPIHCHTAKIGEHPYDEFLHPREVRRADKFLLKKTNFTKAQKEKKNNLFSNVCYMHIQHNFVLPTDVNCIQNYKFKKKGVADYVPYATWFTKDS